MKMLYPLAAEIPKCTLKATVVKSPFSIPSSFSRPVSHK